MYARKADLSTEIHGGLLAHDSLLQLLQGNPHYSSGGSRLQTALFATNCADIETLVNVFVQGVDVRAWTSKIRRVG